VTCFGILAWHRTHEDTEILVGLAKWIPRDIKALTVRERRFWAQWFKAIEDKKVRDAATMRT
jgi:hypothetical protein